MPELPTANFLTRSRIHAFDSCRTPIEKMKETFELNKHSLRVAHLNTSSIPKHIEEIIRTTLETDLDIFACSETNIKNHTPAKRYNIPGYKLIKANRNNVKKGGG